MLPPPKSRLGACLWQVIPGLLMGLLLMVAIYIAAHRWNLPAEPFVGWEELRKSAMTASWGLFLIVIIMGGIYGGIFTPTEAAAVSAVYAGFHCGLRLS